MEKIIVYIDGFNFYFGLREAKWKKFYWLNIVGFFEDFMSENQTLVKVKYFSAKPDHTGKKQRQSKFFDVNRDNEKFELILGNYVKKSMTCQTCHSTFFVPEEKKTDVNIAVNMISDCVKENVDHIILVSGDSDLTPPVDFIKSNNKNVKVSVFFPPRRQGLHLKNICHNSIYLEHYKKRFGKHVFPDKVTLKNGYEIQKPESWKV